MEGGIRLICCLSWLYVERMLAMVATQRGQEYTDQDE
jgi:hypothetical protein